MSQIHAEATAVIDAPPEVVYAILADYRVDHPAILPRQYFAECTVEEGGQGAGTVIRLRMTVMGVERSLRQVVSEPAPGRVLVETDDAAGVVTTFTVEPLEDGKRSRITIATDSKASPGIMGFMEKLFNPFITRRIYREELRLLADYARSKNTSSSSS